MFNVTYTFVFKELFPNYDEFKRLLNIYITKSRVVTDEEDRETFRLLFNNFCNCSVAYDTPDAFYRHFFIEYYNSLEDYLIKLKMIQKLREMPLDELCRELESITNMAHNDNAIVTNPLSDILPYISTQTSSSSTGNKALAIQRAISLYRDNEVYQFLDRFKKLFIFVHGDRRAYFCPKGGC